MITKNILCCIAAAIMAAGCSAEQENMPQKNDEAEQAAEENVTYIYDLQDNVIGQIGDCSVMCLADDKIFYLSQYTDASGNEISEYDLYDLNTKENFTLCERSDLIYEAYYDRVLLGDHLYTAVTTGDFDDSETWEYELLDFDLKNKTVDVLLKEKDDYAYSTLDSFGDDLLLIRSAADGMCVDKYDIDKRVCTRLKKFLFQDDPDFTESLRAVYYDDGEISLLRVDVDTEEQSRLYFDRYDESMELISSTDISDVFDLYEDETNQTERCQPVTDFFYKNGMLFYSNRSISKFLLNIGANDITPIIKDENGDFETARMISKSDQPRLFYRCVEPGSPIYILDTDTGKLTEKAFSVKDESFFIEGMAQYNDKVLIGMTNLDFDAPGGGDYENRLYYVSIDDIIGK